MLEVHRCRQIEWSPSAIVALATSVDGAAVAAARENGVIEIWSVAAGSLGWHCQLTIPGREGAAISSLVWCQPLEGDASPLGRLFSSGLDGLVTEWDLHTLQPRAVVESMGGSIWQLAAEDTTSVVSKGLNGSASNMILGSEDNDSDSDDEGNSSSSDSDDELERRAQRVALACEDGVVRIFEVGTAQQGLIYQKSFPRVKGRILSVAWSRDGERLVAGGSDGCIRCWDITQTREIYRITAGIGGKGKNSDLCIWSLLVLRNGDIVSGDSSGSTQFWDGQLGTLLSVQTRHDADVLALAASHNSVFAAGADGKVVQFQQVGQSQLMSPSDDIDVARGTVGEKWVYVGSKRTHTHDVRALAIATPIVAPIVRAGNAEVKFDKEKKREKRRRMKKYPNSRPNDYWKWARRQTAMLISGGNDAKLFTYPANGFLSFHPHDVCPCPERPFIQLADQSAIYGGTLMMAQHFTRVDIWKIYSKDSGYHSNGSNSENGHSVLGKRKWEGDSDDDSSIQEPMCNGHSNGDKESNALVLHRNGHAPAQNGVRKLPGNSLGKFLGKPLGKSPGTPPALLATIKIKSSEHIVCSAISGDGRLVAFADSQRPRLYELGLKMGEGERESVHIKRRKLPAVLKAAHSVVFSADSSRLLVAGPQGLIWVVDPKSADLVHTFHIPSHDNSIGWANGIVKVMCTSSDGQWLAAASSTGHIAVFNLEVLRHQWTVPMLDGTPATAMVFHPGNNNVLIVSSAANQIHALDVEVRAPGEWSRRNGARVAKKLVNFPGGIIGLSLPSSPTSTSIIAYSSSAMCHIDFSQPIRDEIQEMPEKPVEADQKVIGNGKSHPGSNVTVNGGIVKVSVRSRESKSLAVSSVSSREGKSMVVVNMKNPVLFLGHTGPESVLIAEKPWLEVIRQFPAPVSRHVYGS